MSSRKNKIRGETPYRIKPDVCHSYVYAMGLKGPRAVFQLPDSLITLRKAKENIPNPKRWEATLSTPYWGREMRKESKQDSGNRLGTLSYASGTL